MLDEIELAESLLNQVIGVEERLRGWRRCRRRLVVISRQAAKLTRKQKRCDQGKTGERFHVCSSAKTNVETAAGELSDERTICHLSFHTFHLSFYIPVMLDFSVDAQTNGK